MNAPQTATGGLSREQLSERFNVEISNLLTQTSKLNAEVSKISAETSKLNAKSRWYPVAMAAAIMGAAGGVVGALIALLVKFVL